MSKRTMNSIRYATLGAVLGTSVLASGCKRPAVVLRDPEVYQAEIAFLQMALEQDTLLLEHHLADGSCSCEDGAWTTVECEDTALNVLVIRHRLGWHVDMMHYLGKLSDERPPAEPPDVPDPASLCPADE